MNDTPNPYKTARRITHKNSDKPLKAFALDWTIYFNGQQAGFLEDYNTTDRGPMPFNNIDELSGFIHEELERHHAEHFGAPS